MYLSFRYLCLRNRFKIKQDIWNLLKKCHSCPPPPSGARFFLEALDEQALRVRISEKEPKIVDDALNMASRLEAFDIMGSTGPEAEKGNSKFVRAAAGGKESIVSEGTQMSV